MFISQSNKSHSQEFQIDIDCEKLYECATSIYEMRYEMRKSFVTKIITTPPIGAFVHSALGIQNVDIFNAAMFRIMFPLTGRYKYLGNDQI